MRHNVAMGRVPAEGEEATTMQIGQADPENPEVVDEVRKLLEFLGAADLLRLVDEDSRHQKALMETRVA